VGEHHALGRTGRARRKDELPHLVRAWPYPGGELRFPVGWERVVRIGAQCVHGRRREALEVGVARIGCVTAGADDEVLRRRLRNDVLDGVVRHAQVEWDQDQPRPHRPEIDGRQRGGRRRPCEQPVAGLEPERSEPPRSEAAASIELVEAPVPDRAVVGAQPDCVPIAEAGDGRFEEIEERVHRAERSRSKALAARLTRFGASATLRRLSEPGWPRDRHEGTQITA
jgi:hypothetical protein